MTFKQSWKKLHKGWDFAAVFFVAVGLSVALLPFLPTPKLTSVISFFIPSSAAAVAAFFTPVMSTLFIAAGLAAGLIAVLSHVAHIRRQGLTAKGENLLVDAVTTPTTSSSKIQQNLTATANQAVIGQLRERMADWEGTGKSQTELEQLIRDEIARYPGGEGIKKEQVLVACPQKNGPFSIVLQNITDPCLLGACQTFMSEIGGINLKTIKQASGTQLTGQFSKKAFLPLVKEKFVVTQLSINPAASTAENFAGSGESVATLRTQIKSDLCLIGSMSPAYLNQLREEDIELYYDQKGGKIFIEIMDPLQMQNAEIRSATNLLMISMGGKFHHGQISTSRGEVGVGKFIKHFAHSAVAVTAAASGNNSSFHFHSNRSTAFNSGKSFQVVRVSPSTNSLGASG
jgi:hypothetical protein